MRRPVAVVVLVAGIFVALAAGIAAYVLADYSWNQVADYASPYLAGAALPAAKAGPPRTQRLVLVIVDGLREDTSRQMSALNKLRGYGSDLVLTVPQPSLSYPNWTTILSGAPQRVSGVTTNGFDRRVPVETLLDTAIAAGDRTLVVGPWALDTLFGATRVDAHYLHDYPSGVYGSRDVVLHAVALAAVAKARFVLVHLPDVDEAGHTYGAASPQYAAAAQEVDQDISVLVSSLQDGNTSFVVVADHGHIAAGGHGGWEPEVLQVPCVLAGRGVGLGSGTGKLVDVAPTVAALLGVPTPREAVGRILPSVLASPDPKAQAAETEQRTTFLAHYLDVVERVGAQSGGADPARLASLSESQLAATLDAADNARLTSERSGRAPLAAGLALGAVLVLVAIGLLSWRALVAGGVGAAAYYAVYDGLYFGVHHYSWSLSSIDTEEVLRTFQYWRLGEAFAAGFVAVAVAGLLYPLLRRQPRGPVGRYLFGWLSLGPATVLATQATLVGQVAWYLWWWGAKVTWILPDLRLGFKYDLDLLQCVALGVAAVVSPLVTWLVGRYHPRVARPGPGPRPTSDAAPVSAEE